MNTEQILLVLAVIVVLGWFAWGVITNLRRGNALLKWMQKGLPLIGEKTTLRWLGTSVAELVLTQPKQPFKQMTVMVVLAPRDVLWFWALAALQKRKDLLIFRSQLTSAPRIEFELVDPNTWTGRLAADAAVKRGWSVQNHGRLRLYAPEGQIEKALAALPPVEAGLQSFGSSPIRCSVRHEAPHLEVHLPPPDPRREDAHAYFRALQNLATVIRKGMD